MTAEFILMYMIHQFYKNAEFCEIIVYLYIYYKSLFFNHPLANDHNFKNNSTK